MGRSASQREVWPHMAILPQEGSQADATLYAQMEVTLLPFPHSRATDCKSLPAALLV